MSKSCVRFVSTSVAIVLLAVSAGAARASESLDVSYISSDIVGAIVFHPHKALTDPQFEMLPIEVLSAYGQDNFAIDPVDIEEAVIVFGLAALASGEPGVGAVLRFAKPYDSKAVIAKLGEQVAPVNFGGKKCLKVSWPGAPPFCVHMPNDKTLILGNEPQIKRMLMAENVDSPLIKLLKRADTSKTAVAVLDFATLRPLAMLGMQNVPPLPPAFEPFVKLPELVKSVELSVNVQNSFDIAIRVDGNDEKAAGELKELAERAKKLAREMLLPMIAGGLEQSNDTTQRAAAQYVKRMFNTTLDNIVVKQEGDAVKITMAQGSPVVATTGVLVGLLLPAVQSAREAARRAQSMNNMKQMGLAMHNHLSAQGAFPARAIRNKDGKPLLSWRVALLPYLEVDAGENLDFHFDEPWDSDHNKKLIDKMPAVFRSPNSTDAPGRTNYLAADGKQSIFGGEKGTSAQQITDGLSNTIMVVEADHGVIWTKPDDLDYDEENPTKGLRGLRPNGFNALMGDGSVRFLMNGIDLETLKGLMTKDAGEPVSVP